MFQAILAVLNAIPALKSVFDQFVAWYVAAQIDAMKEDQRAALRKAIEKQDQTDLEKTIGYPHAGEPSNTPGTVIRDSLPGVHL
jgi:hypothetical protein